MSKFRPASLRVAHLNHPCSRVATRGMRDQVQIASFIRTFSVTIAHCSKAFEAVVVIKQQAALQARSSRGGGGARRCTSTRRQREHAIARVHQCQPHQREPHPTRPRLTALLSKITDVLPVLLTCNDKATFMPRPQPASATEAHSSARVRQGTGTRCSVSST